MDRAPRTGAKLQHRWMIVLLAGVLGCSSSPVAVLRATTYPPPFNYVPPERLRETMWRLAANTYELDRVVREDSRTGAYQRDRILELLAGIEAAAEDLGPGGWPSNHPRIAGDADQLRDDIRRARLAVVRDPPNYYFAGAISGACLYCHAP